MKSVANCTAAIGSLFLCAIAAHAETQPTPEAPVIMAAPVITTIPENQLVVPKNTPVPLTVNDEVSSKTVRVGDSFALTVAQDVVVNNYVVVPKGTRGTAEITWRTGKGAFGKSAKMEFELRYLELGGRRIPIQGKHRQEGSGNTGATVGAVIAVGVFGGFVTGKSAVISRGREFTAHTKDDFTVAMAVVPAPAAMPVAAKPVPADAAPNSFVPQLDAQQKPTAI